MVAASKTSRIEPPPAPRQPSEVVLPPPSTTTHLHETPPTVDSVVTTKVSAGSVSINNKDKDGVVVTTVGVKEDTNAEVDNNQNEDAERIDVSTLFQQYIQEIYSWVRLRFRATMDDVEPEETVVAMTAVNGDTVTSTSTTPTRWSIRRPYHQSTFVWCIVLLVFQLVFYPLWIHPILSSTVALSRFLLSTVYGRRRSSSNNGATGNGVMTTEELLSQTVWTVHELQQELQTLVQQEQLTQQQLSEWTTTTVTTTMPLPPIKGRMAMRFPVKMILVPTLCVTMKS